MTGVRPPSVTGEPVELEETLGPPPRRSRWWLGWMVLVVVLIGAGGFVERTNPGGVSFGHPLGVHRHASIGVPDNGAATSLYTVSRRTLSVTTPVNGTLGYAGSYTVLGGLRGTITQLPAVGQVIPQGQVLYRVDGYPVVLLYGSTPAYRTLTEGATAADVSGQDVAELNHDLVALGYVDKSDVDSAWDEFGWATKAGIENLQEHLGVDQTGNLTLGQVVFLPTPARVTSLSAQLGGQAGGPIMTATSTTRQVSVNLDADQQSQVKAGDRVTITLPDNSTTPGVVSSVGTVATTPTSNGSSNNTATVSVHIKPTRPIDTGRLDQAPVQVAITTATVRDALVVPVNALLALAGGGYAVEVADSDGTHRLVPVSPGLFDDAADLVQATGTGLAAGQHVVVPAS
jgi:HlyD family secretion protein/Putative peptidoglycan binding domain